MMTIEELKSMLSKGKGTDEIRKQFFNQATEDIRELCLGSGMDFDSLGEVLKENGYDLKDYEPQKYWNGMFWKVKLSNTTITLYRRYRGRGLMKFYDDEESSAWYISFFDKSKIMDAIREADARCPEVFRVWATFEKEIKKFEKVREISENAIESLVKEKLKGTGIEYNLKLEPTDVFLKIKMKRGRFLEIKLPHKGFSDILSDGFIKDINSVAQALNSIRYTCRIQRYGNNINWFKSE